RTWAGSPGAILAAREMQGDAALQATPPPPRTDEFPHSFLASEGPEFRQGGQVRRRTAAPTPGLTRWLSASPRPGSGTSGRPNGASRRLRARRGLSAVAAEPVELNSSA